MEIHYLPVLGLLFIAIGWALQYNAIGKKGGEVNRVFPLAYSAGVVLLIADSFIGGMFDLAVMNAICLLAAIGVYTKIK